MFRTNIAISLFFTLAKVAAALPAADGPNIVYILCDDLGYGDIHCLAPKTSKIPTPNADRLASEGMIFTDAHSGSSVCTPTRYGILTGRYCWRTRLQRGVSTGFRPSLIDPDRMTVAEFLKIQGYATAAIGKWHLDYLYQDPVTAKRLSKKKNAIPPVGAMIPDGPVSRGFDFFHGFHHARHIEAVVQGDRVVEHDKAINMLPRLQRTAIKYLEANSQIERPFFLYLALNSPHTPIVPGPQWQGKSGLGDYADFVMQTDSVVGEVCRTLSKLKMEENTIVILTSDNGCSKAANIEALARQGHHVSANFRGSKSDIWEGGHRVPFIVHWPKKIEPGTSCDQLICLNDLFATVADILVQEVPAGTCEDSVSFLPALSGKRINSSRSGVVHHSISGHFAYRKGDWKMILAKGSGGWTSPTEAQSSKDAPTAQLYNLKEDVGEQANRRQDFGTHADGLLELLTRDVNRGRSTKGPPSENDVKEIDLWKSEARKN